MTLLLAATLIGQPAIVSAATIRVHTEDGPRQVWLGDAYLGTTPVVADDVEPGAYELSVGGRPEDSEWLHPWVQSIELVEDSNLVIDVPSLQRLRVMTEPITAELRIVGVEVGWTPLRVLVPSRVSSTFEFHGVSETVQREAYHPMGAPDSTVIIRFENVPAYGRETTRSSGPGWFAKRQYLLPVGAAAAAVLGVWARQSANRAYEDYVATTDRAKMKSKYDKAENLDDFAVSLWITAEVLLAAAAYTWLRSDSSKKEIVRVAADPSSGGGRVGFAIDSLWKEAPEGGEAGP